MKKIFHKNQVIITVLALLIAVAGYISYDRSLKKEAKGKENTEQSVQANLDLSEEDLIAEVETEANNTDALSAEITGELPEEDYMNPGESVLTSAEVSSADFATAAKLDREQVNSKNKSTLQEIIDRADVDQQLKQSAIDELVTMTENAKKESDAEMLLSAKGFSNVVVSISEGSCDVVLDMGEATDAKRAQVEDIVKRKTGIAAENIIITTLSGSAATDTKEVWTQE